MNRNSYSRTRLNQVDAPTAIYPYISKSIILFFCGYIVIWYLQIGYRVPFLGTIRFEFMYAGILTVLAFYSTPRMDLKCPLVPYVAFYFLVIIVQVPFSYDVELSWNIFIDRIVKFAFMAFFITAFVRSPTHLKLFLGAFLLACMKMGQEGLIGHLSGSMIWENQGIMRLHGPTPNYGHPNSYSGMAIGTLPFVYFLWPLGNNYFKAIYLTIAGLSSHIVLFSGSRTAYVGLMAFLAFTFYLSNNKMKFLGIFILATVLALPLIPEDYYGRFQSIFTHEEKEGKSTEARFEILQDSWEIFKEHPFGVGIAAFPKVRKERFGRTQDTHNLYFEIATNLGVQGLVIVGMMLYTMMSLLNLIRTRAGRLKSSVSVDTIKYPNIKDDLALIEAVSLATLSFLIIRLTLGLFGMDMYEIYWWFAIGITVSLYSMLNRITQVIDRYPV
jgi:putative inorganic carbon (hco3(-)) transporter